MDIMSENHECDNNIDEVTQYLDELENVLAEGSQTIDSATKRCENFKILKEKLAGTIVKLKKKLDEERIRRKNVEEKVECLEKALAEEKSAFGRVKKENERMVDIINYMKRKQKSCEMENEKLLDNMEIIKGRVAEEREGQTVQEQRMTRELAGLQFRLQYYKREMVRSKIIIQFGAKGMHILKRNLELCVSEMDNQKAENEELKQELVRYKSNYSARNRNYDFMMQDLQNLELFLQPKYQSFCFRKSGRRRLVMKLVRRIKELLMEAYCHFLVT